MVIISHKLKFIYIKTRKTASTSIQVLLENFCGKEDIITPIKKPTTREGILYNKKARNYKKPLSYVILLKYRFLLFMSSTKPKDFLKKFKDYISKSSHYKNIRGFFSKFQSHMSAEKVKMKVGKNIWNQYFKFTFERNPWDKLLSFYFHLKPNQPFEDWVRRVKLSPYAQPYNYPLYSIDGKNALDFIGKFESLKESLNYIFNKLNIPLKQLPSEKTTYRKDKEDYRKFYNNQTKKIVERNYREEIKLFGYTF